MSGLFRRGRSRRRDLPQSDRLEGFNPDFRFQVDYQFGKIVQSP